jgi:hypothetical protein
MNLPAQIQDKLGDRQTQAIIVGVLILALIAILQVVHSRQSQPLVALIESQQSLCEGDLERMEFAIGKSGIEGCKIENGTLMVPRHRKEDCLNAIAENDALPQFLRTEQESEPTINPFLSRTQQKQIEDTRKKRLVREMVMRLPFVKNAWFEMDTASSASAFKPAQQTAVVSVEPPADMLLDPEQVATVREMIAGAIAGLPSENIRVIDITSGYAHLSGASNKRISIDQRTPYEQETFYRKRIQQAIEPWGDIDVQVRVERVEIPSPAKQVSYVAPPVEKAKPSVPTVSVIGTNGTASIHNSPVEKTPAPVVVVQPVVSEPTYASRVDVFLQVPESAAAQLSIGRSTFPADKPNIKQQATNKLGRTLVDTVKPMLPKQSFAQGTPFPISIQFIPPAVTPVVEAPNWQAQIREIAAKHWPSGVVLLGGLFLLTLMTRYSPYEFHEDEEENEDIISINTSTTDAVSENTSEASTPEVALAQPEDYAARRSAEQKLGSIVEKDPESAARVIESWIRNAG